MATPVELILICLVAVALLALVARKIGVPYPILRGDRGRQAGSISPSRPRARSFRLDVRRHLSSASIQQNVSPKKSRTLAADSLDCLGRNARRRFVSRRSRNPLS